MADLPVTPLDEYIAALDRTAAAARELADTLRGARTEESLLRAPVLSKWSELTERMSADADLISHGSERYQRWARARYRERIEQGAYRLPPYQR